MKPVGKVLKHGDIVIYESTVYPGVTEEECVPVLEKISGLTFNIDFYVGYSPERINPGDKEHTIEKISESDFRIHSDNSETDRFVVCFGDYRWHLFSSFHKSCRSGQGH